MRLLVVSNSSAAEKLNMGSAFMHVLSDSLRSLTTLVEAILILTFPGDACMRKTTRVRLNELVTMWHDNIPCSSPRPRPGQASVALRA